jgi:hypothetical protein
MLIYIHVLNTAVAAAAETQCVQVTDAKRRRPQEPRICAYTQVYIYIYIYIYICMCVYV